LSCGAESNLELDHIKPTSKFPELTFEFSNLQILCKSCNAKKSNKTYCDFRPNACKWELWSKEKRKMFKDLADKQKLVAPVREPVFAKYKGTLKDYRDGTAKLRLKKMAPSLEKRKRLSLIEYTLEDILKQ
jgi:hypothetical protein